MNDPGFPCGMCGVNAYTDCRHRPGEPPIDRSHVIDHDDRRGTPRPGNGNNFRTRKRGMAARAKTITS